jgi:toxin ParE1/3/4
MLESARYYDERSAGLGGDFLTAVEETTGRIQQFPDAAPIGMRSVRKRLVSGFPFMVLYKYEREDNRIFIAAVMHQRRRPGYWRHRLHR